MMNITEVILKELTIDPLLPEVSAEGDIYKTKLQAAGKNFLIILYQQTFMLNSFTLDTMNKHTVVSPIVAKADS